MSRSGRGFPGTRSLNTHWTAASGAVWRQSRAVSDAGRGRRGTAGVARPHGPPRCGFASPAAGL